MNSTETISAMIYRYCELIDSGDFDGFVEQFRYGRMGNREVGDTESLRKWISDNMVLYDGSPRTKHLTTNLVVEVNDEEGVATARSYVTVLHSAPGLPLAIVGCAEYHDRFECVDGTWRWAERTVDNQLEGDSKRHTRGGA